MVTKEQKQIYKKRDYEKNKDRRKATSKEWAKKNPDKRKRHRQSWRIKMRKEVIEAYGGKCACCGETAPEFLTIDHINNDGAEHRKTLKGGAGRAGACFYRWLKSQGYPKDNYQLLCMNCNFAKGHFNECPHKRDPNTQGKLC